ncbi:MAG: glycogen debranching protein GlgX [Propionibacteriales bacterium]|nr:glycogen debranching protein GlgX [Propionibacteriales bacterium]
MGEDDRVTTTPPVWPGRHTPLGAYADGTATNFAVWTPDATGVELCLFDDHGHQTTLDLVERSHGVWYGRVPGVGHGQRYGFRVHGPWDPGRGHRFNPAKLLLDPYAGAVTGQVDPRPEIYPYVQEGGDPGAIDARDSAPYVARSVVVSDEFDWGDDRHPRVPWSDTVIYELHVKGFTRLHPAVPEHMRGTYAGLADPSVVGYLADLGVTAVELLPIHQFVTEPALSERGVPNYWGYNSIGFFAPHAAYSSSGTLGEQVREFKELVKTLHSAGLEVILDVVYNHTAEGGELGPGLAFRGYGDGAYYRRLDDGTYADYTGCGNTFDTTQPQGLTLVLDSLRYWVEEMHVDGFRFDLAPALARNGHLVDLRGPFLAAVGQDPVLRDVKLIAEPWDATADGYSLGSFPAAWCEWNDQYRDTLRDFWRGRPGTLRDLGNRLSGSSDLYADDGRLPYASINFICAHDGFTMRDLVTYDHKHNEANGEHNRDGTDNNRSWNCGVEGETDDPGVNALRQRQVANLMSSLLLSTGVPMLVAGDERGRTQRGNNNPFCQDNEISWLDWSDDAAWWDLHGLTRWLLRLRHEHPVLRQRHFFAGEPMRDGGRKDLTWVHPTGVEMTDEHWHDDRLLTVGVFLAGDAIRTRGHQGERITDISYLLWLHSGADDTTVTLPDLPGKYDEVLCTARLHELDTGPARDSGAEILLPARSVLLLTAP